MTKEELLKELVTVYERNRHDPEADHGEADELLLAFIDDEKITAAFSKIHKWYA